MPTRWLGENRLHLAAIGAVLLCFAFAIWMIHPFADLLYGGDDWAYAWSAERMVRDGKLVASSWVAAATVPQVFWGAAFCEVFGLSFRVMNVSTLVLSLAGPVLVYLVGLELGLSVRHAALVSFFATINPLYLSFASSFMSDTYYVVLMLASLLSYTRGLRRGRPGLLVLGSVFASVALLQRQIGIAAPAAVVASLCLGVLSKRRTLGRAASEACAAACLPAVSALIFRKFPDAFGGTTVTQRVKLNSVALWERFKDVNESLQNGYTTLLYVAAFMVPFTLALLPAFVQSLRAIRSRTVQVSAGLLVALSLVGWGFALAEKLNIWVPGEFFHAVAIPLFGMALWKAIALAGSIVFPLLALAFVVQTKATLFGQQSARTTVTEPSAPDDAVLAHAALAFTLVFHLLLVATFIAFYNNYFLPLIPLALLLAATLLRSTELGSSWRAWLLPGAAGLFSLIWSIVSIDQMFRYVEADDRLTASMTASGIQSALIFDYAGAYARRNYDLVDAEVVKDPWKAFRRLRGNAQFVILPGERRAPGGFRKLVQTQHVSDPAGRAHAQGLCAHARGPAQAPAPQTMSSKRAR
jgi:hypothetical protein